MSKKLLEENTIRQFMKLANIKSDTTSSFLKEKFDRKLNEVEEFEDLEEDPAEEADLGGPPEGEMDLGEEPEEEIDLDDEPEEPIEEPAEEESELIVDPDDAPVVIKFLENLLGLLKEEAGEDAEEVEMELEPEEEMELEPEEEMGGEELAPEEEEEEMAPLQMEAMVNKIASRVAKRILSKK